MRTRGEVAAAVVLGVLCAGSGWAQAAPATRVEPAIHIEDVALFYHVYDAAGGHPEAAQLQHDYLDRGSDGLHNFARLRNITGTAIAATLARRPELYSGARRCMAVLPAVRRRFTRERDALVISVAALAAISPGRAAYSYSSTCTAARSTFICKSRLPLSGGCDQASRGS